MQHFGQLGKRVFAYSSLGRLVSKTQPESGLTAYEYFDNGALKKRTDAGVPAGTTGEGLFCHDRKVCSFAATGASCATDTQSDYAQGLCRGMSLRWGDEVRFRLWGLRPKRQIENCSRAMKTIAYIFSILIVIRPSLAQAQSLSPEKKNSMLVLSGLLQSRGMWGPPGFGETRKVDVRTVIYVLRLSSGKSSSELQLPSEAEYGKSKFREVQVKCEVERFPQCYEILKKNIGKRLTLVGETSYSVYPTDYLPVNITVRLIRR